MTFHNPTDELRSERKVIHVLTHNGEMHADEVAAIAALIAFNNLVISVTRTRDENLISAAKLRGDLLIDLGREFNGVNLFDHHQDTELLSSAGLIWNFIDMKDKYPEVSKLISIIDDQDRGIKKAGQFEIPVVIDMLNGKFEEQDANFEKAVNLMIDIFVSMKEAVDSMRFAKEIVSKSKEIIPGVLKLEAFTPHWNKFYNGKMTPTLRCVIWDDENTHDCKGQVIPVEPDSFDLHGIPFSELNSDKMTFVHAAGFFCVADNEGLMLEYLS